MNRRGFTLLEILVSLAAVGVMMTVVILRFQGAASAERSLNLAAGEVRSAVQLAQDYARSSYDCCGGDIVYGYGVHVDLDDPEGYLLFADKNDNFSFDGAATDAVVEEFSLPAGVEFDDWWYNYGMTRHVSGGRSVAFPVPAGDAYDNGSEISAELRVGLTAPGAPLYKYFFIDGSSWQVTIVDEFFDNPLTIPPLGPGPK